MRRNRIKSAWALLLVAVCGAAAGSARMPNVVLILADDLGLGDLGCNGQVKFETPNIDALAKHGMKFANHYSGSAVCAPSRCALLTGCDMGHAAVRGNAEIQPEGQEPMPADTFTVAHLFKQAGYATGIFGKWGLGMAGSASDPHSMGFDSFYGYSCQRQAHCYYPAWLWRNNEREFLWGNEGSFKKVYAPGLVHKEALDFIRANRDRPFFLYYAAVQPHADMIAPECYMLKYRGKFLPEMGYEGGYYIGQPEGHAAYAAMVNVLDDYVGEVVAELGRLGIADNTLVIFSSDNGAHEEGGADPGYFASNGIFRGFKRDLYDGGIHVPFIAVWPGRIRAGSESGHISAFWDFLPTMAELLQVPVEAPVDGISYLPTLLGEAGQKDHDYLYWEFTGKGGRKAIRKGKWKGVLYDLNKNPNAPLELYDLDRDPGERENLAKQYPEVVAELCGLIGQARTSSHFDGWNFPEAKK